MNTDETLYAAEMLVQREDSTTRSSIEVALRALRIELEKCIVAFDAGTGKANKYKLTLKLNVLPEKMPTKCTTK